MWLAGCASFGAIDGGGKVAELPPLPADLRACFGPATRVPAPPPGPLTERKLVALIGALKRSELAHDLCGRRLIAWYEDVAAKLAGGR